MTTISVNLADIGSNACPSGHNPILSLGACRAAIRLLLPEIDENGDKYYGERFVEVENETGFPVGCYYTTDASFYGDYAHMVFFNEHPTGSADADGSVQSLCERGLVPLQPERVLFVGDSDIDYWDDSTSLFDGAYNVGYAGYTCTDVRDEMANWTVDFDPETVVLVCGENDMLGGTSPEKAFGVFRSVVQGYLRAGAAKVVYMGTKDEPWTLLNHPNLLPAYDEYDGLIKEYAAALAVNAADATPPLVVIDSNAGFNAIGNPDRLYGDDDLHLSEEGYELWNRWVVQAVMPGPGLEGCYLYSSGECLEGGAETTTAPPSVAAQVTPNLETVAAETEKTAEEGTANTEIVSGVATIAAADAIAEDAGTADSATKISLVSAVLVITNVLLAL